MALRIDTSEANLRATPNTSQAPLARLPVGHLVTETGAMLNGWQPCQITIDTHDLNGFIKGNLLRQPLNPQVDRLVELAGIEYRKFLFGTRHETHPASKPDIDRYWHTLYGNNHTEPVSTAWSAAFISYIVRKANLGKSFDFASAHTTYFSDSKVAFQHNDNSRAFWAVPLNHSALRIGDLVGYTRQPGLGYDDLPGAFISHSDVVVAIHGSTAVTIGGNVSNTVKVTEVPLDSQGKVLAGGKRILVMHRNF